MVDALAVLDCAGVRIARTPQTQTLADLLDRTGLASAVALRHDGDTLCAALTPERAARWTPDHDTLALEETLAPMGGADDLALEREILTAMLASPQAFAFDSVDELVSCVRMRRHIAQAAAHTALAFDTEAKERPAEDWHYDNTHGFLLKPGRDLIEALVRATQPEPDAPCYAFSCYRATEYVILLGIARELRDSNPALLAQLQQLCERDAVRSARFHEVFLREYGSMEAPLPANYFVPGDRLWFRNPDARSADITGYEGSWVIYLGGGLFSNFWRRNAPYTLQDKALEIYHWRHAVVGAADALQIDETRVLELVAETRADPDATARVLERMLRPRDPKGVYAEGGCLDTTREYPRQVRPGTTDLVLP
jgi:hypothetical protein